MAATKVEVLAAWTSSFQGEAEEFILLLELARRRIRTDINCGIEMKSHCPYFHKADEYIFGLLFQCDFSLCFFLCVIYFSSGFSFFVSG